MPQAIPYLVAELMFSAIAQGINQTSAEDQQDTGAPTYDVAQKINTTKSSAYLPLIYGETIVGINRVYIGSSGADQEYLHLIGNVAEGEIVGLTWDGHPTPELWLDDIPYTDPRFGNITNVHAPLVYFEFFTGTPTQGICSLQNWIPEWNQAKRNTAYIYIRLLYDKDTFQGVPEITMRVRGRKVYNPQTQTTDYSTNPALCTRDYLTRSSARGGMGISASRVDDDSINSAASYCNVKGWTCNYTINSNDAVSDVLTQMLGSFRGSLVFSQDKFKIKYRDLNYETSVMDLTEDDVVQQSNDSTLHITEPSLADTPNGITISYINRDNNYESDTYPFAPADLIQQDNGDYREKSITINSIDNSTQAAKMASYLLESARVNLSTDFTAGYRTRALEPEDLVTLTHSVPGWNKKLFRVLTAALNYDGTVALVINEEDPSFYDDTYNLQQHNWNDTLLPDPSASVPSVTNIQQSEETYVYADRTFTRWNITFDPPDPKAFPWWDYAGIWVKIGIDGNWAYATRAESGFCIDPVQEGQNYFCKLQSHSIQGTTENFDNAPVVSRMIMGKTTIPSDLASISAIASGDSIAITATELTDPDLLGYEIRLGPSWLGGIFIGFVPKPAWSRSAMKPGTYTFWMAAEDNRKKYSAIPKSAVATVLFPIGYTTLVNWAWTFATGTFSNAEDTTYNGYNALKCSHASGNLTGTWTSPVYDLGTVEQVKVWGDFLSEFNASSLTWGGLAPSGTTWQQLTLGYKTWGDIFAAIGGVAQINATLKWGNSPDNLNNSIDFFHISAPEIVARYFQVEVTITDPNLDANLYLYTLNMTVAQRS
jgi:hypothetical protein